MTDSALDHSRSRIDLGSRADIAVVPVSILIVGIGGTTRNGSSTEKSLRIALSAAENMGATTVMLGAEDLDLPMYAPERQERTPKAIRLIDLLRRSDGVIVASPGYHGTLSGLVKNALDYVEDMRGDDPPYLDGRAVGTIACGQGWPGTVHTLAALRSVAHALRGWPTPMGAGINSAEAISDRDGSIADPKSRLQLELVGQQVAEFALARGKRC
jgi:FMN reductase